MFAAVSMPLSSRDKAEGMDHPSKGSQTIDCDEMLKVERTAITSTITHSAIVRSAVNSNVHQMEDRP